MAYFISVNLPGDAKQTMQTSGETGPDLDKSHTGACKLESNDDRVTEISLRHSLHIQTFKKLSSRNERHGSVLLEKPSVS